MSTVQGVINDKRHVQDRLIPPLSHKAMHIPPLHHKAMASKRTYATRIWHLWPVEAKLWPAEADTRGPPKLTPVAR